MQGATGVTTYFPPTLKQLRYLSAIAKTLHFGKAAELCHVTQSTLSAGLQELESLLDAKLVERSKRSVMLTPLGRDICIRADKILSDVDELMGLAATANNPKSGSLRLGVIPTVSPFLLPRVMPAVREHLPDLTLYLTEEKSPVLCDMLRNGHLDLVLCALPYQCGDTVEYPLFEDPFIGAYPPDKTVQTPLTVEALKTETLLLLEEGHCMRDHALAACEMATGQTHSSLASTSLFTLVQMVAGGHGVTLLPRLAVDAGLTDGLDLQIIRFKDKPPFRTVGLLWRKTSTRTTTFKLLGDVIRDTVIGRET